jgi:enoyl-CoA hydratase/carnithine racemase
VTPPLVTHAVDGRVAIVTLDRPQKLNAIDAEMKRQLLERITLSFIGGSSGHAGAG